MPTRTDSQTAAPPKGPAPRPDEGFESRHHPRHPLNLRVRYPRRNAFFYEFTRNVSQGGMFIDTEHPLEIGRRLRFELDVPGELEPLRLLGEVKWRVGLEDAAEGVDVTPGMGIEFVFDDADERAALHERVRSMLESTFGRAVARGLAPQWPT